MWDKSNFKKQTFVDKFGTYVHVFLGAPLYEQDGILRTFKLILSLKNTNESKNYSP